MKRYESMHFPALRGEPVETDSFLIAWLIAFWRVVGGAIEGRIIDRKTGRHTVI